MIFLGLGANLHSERFGPPVSALRAAIGLLQHADIVPLRQSSWYETAPVPMSDQPWYVNAVLEVGFAGSPAALLGQLHEIEARIGRVRAERWGPRVIDLDLLVWHDEVIGWPKPGSGLPPDDPGRLVVPHPRLHQRAFVLVPMAELAADWRHPVLRRSVVDFLGSLPDGQVIRRLAE